MYKEKVNHTTLKLFKTVVLPKTNNRPNPYFAKQQQQAKEKGIELSESFSVFDKDELAQIIDFATTLFGLNKNQTTSTIRSNWDHDFDTTNNIFHQTFMDPDYYVAIEPTNDIVEVDNTPVTLIQLNTITKKELNEKIKTILNGNMALNQDMIDGIVGLIEYFEFNIDIKEVNNKEVQAILIDKLGLTPKDLPMFIRYALYRASGSALMIKNKQTASLLTQYDDTTVETFHRFYKKTPMSHIAKDFHRYKFYLMPLKHMHKSLKHPINKIRKAADKYHKPLPLDPLTDAVRSLDLMDNETFKEKVQNRDNAQLIKAINALRLFLARSGSSFVTLYRIRNGRTFKKELEGKTLTALQMGTIHERLNILNTILIDNLKEKYNDKNVIIVLDNNMNIPAPTSMKSAVGSLPLYTSTTISDDVIVGINWEFPADIDLSAASINHFVSWNNAWESGWTNAWQSGDNNGSFISYSGDMQGLNTQGQATELIKIDKKFDESVIVSNVLYSSYMATENLEKQKYKLFVADHSKLDTITKNELHSSDKPLSLLKDIRLVASIDLSKNSRNLGLVLPTNNDKHMFILTNETVKSSNVLYADEQNKLIEDLRLKAITSVTINEIARKLGYVVTTKLPTDTTIDDSLIFDFSTQNISVDSLIDFLQ